MDNKQEQLSLKAIQYVKKHINEMINKFVINNNQINYKDKSSSVSYFMAGSPGAGKTEFSKRLADLPLGEEVLRCRPVRLDPDEIREILPEYNGRNSYVFQRACSLAIDKIHDYLLNYNIDFILDGTFSDYKRASENVTRSLNKNRRIIIFYIYQDPRIAWELTKKRELEEGRFIPKDAFIKHFFGARETVDKIKKKFKEVRVDVASRILKTQGNSYSQLQIDVGDVGVYTGKKTNIGDYSIKLLQKILKEK